MTRQLPASGEADDQQHKTHGDEAEHDKFQSLHGRQQRKQRAKFVKFQIVLLHQEHYRRYGGESKRAVSLQNSGCMQTAECAGKFRFCARRQMHIQRWHQRKNANGKKHRRGKCGKKFEARQQRVNQTREADRPEQEGRRFVEIVDGATVQRHAAFKHCERVERNAGGEQKIVRPFVAAKTFAPEKNGIQRAQAIKNYGEQKTMPVGEPSHVID